MGCSLAMIANLYSIRYALDMATIECPHCKGKIVVKDKPKTQTKVEEVNAHTSIFYILRAFDEANRPLIDEDVLTVAKEMFPHFKTRANGRATTDLLRLGYVEAAGMGVTSSGSAARASAITKKGRDRLRELGY